MCAMASCGCRGGLSSELTTELEHGRTLKIPGWTLGLGLTAVGFLLNIHSLD